MWNKQQEYIYDSDSFNGNKDDPIYGPVLVTQHLTTVDNNMEKDVLNKTSGNASDSCGSGVSESTVAGVVFMTTLEAKGLKYECMIEVTFNTCSSDGGRRKTE